MADLAVEFAGLALPHPLMLGSGPIAVRAADLRAFGQVASAIVTKSISALPSHGSPKPRIARSDRDGMLNYEGGPNPGIDAFCETLRDVVPSIPCPIIGSISARTLAFDSGAGQVVEKFARAGVRAIELDFKYLYDRTKGRSDFRPRDMSGILARVRTAADVPVIAKFAYGPIELGDLARAAEDGGAAAISAINTVFPAMRIGLRTRRPLLSMNYGGLSGAPIRPLAVAAIFRLHEATKLPLIGIGGVTAAEDVVEFVMAGATAVQVYTAAQLGGPDIFPKLRDELRQLLDGMGVASLSELRGAAHGQRNPVVDRQWEAIGGLDRPEE
jgi:dihydroorotate dehydrogenase (NAD+) catalytic subunit